MNFSRILLIASAVWCAAACQGEITLNTHDLRIRVGAAARLTPKPTDSSGYHWESSAPQIAEVYQNGFIVGLAAGSAKVTVQSPGETSFCTVTVDDAPMPTVEASTLKQFPDSRPFTVEGRKCFGSELNGQRAVEPEERKYTRSNRVMNPTPLRTDKPLYWELQSGAEIYDGAGVLMGTVPPSMKIGEKSVPASMFNFGASKVLHGKICVYAFSVSIKPSAELSRSLNPAELTGGRVSTSAWLPLDQVVDKEHLLERIGLGKLGLRALPLEATGIRITGGNPKLYDLPTGELSIVKQIKSGPVPSHYLRRPSGTINLVYSVPGFGLGGEGTDSFLVSDGLLFYPAKGAKVFVQPTYFPAGHPKAGEVSPQTMTFIYGAVKGNGFAPVYGWIAKEALATDSQ